MSAVTVEREWPAEQWGRLHELLYDRIRSRLWLMRDTPDMARTERSGDDLGVCTTSLEGAYFIVDDMLKEMDEATEILNF